MLIPRSTLDPAAFDEPVGLALWVPVPLLLAEAGLPVADVLMPEDDPVPVGAEDEPVLVTPLDVPVAAGPETVSAAAYRSVEAKVWQLEDAGV